MRRLAIFTIIGILALAGCGDSSDSGGSSPPIDPTAESGDGESAIDKSQKLLKPWDFPKDSDERSPMAEPGKTKDDTKTKESKTPKADPGPTPVSIPGPGICGRTPEIQNALINDLNIASCRAINDAELYRVREISFDTGNIKPGDLTGFVNLKTLKISGLNEPITPGSFAGLKSLTILHIDMKLLEEETATFGAKAFQGMPELKQLTIQNRSEKAPLLFKKNAFQGINHLTILIVNGYASIESGTFNKSGEIDHIAFGFLESMPNGGLDGLSVKTLGVDNTKRIFPGSLDGVEGIQYLNISADLSSLEKLRAVSADPFSDIELQIPKGLFSKLEELRSVTMNNFKWPPEIELNNLEVLCEIKSGTNNNWDREVIIIVNGEKVEYLTTEKAGENKEICKIAIGDQIKEILIRKDEE